MYKEVLSYIRWQLFFHPSIDTPFKTILPCQFPSPFIIHISRLQIIMLLLLQVVFKMGVYVGYLVKKFDKRLSDKYPGQCPLEHTPRRTNAPCWCKTERDNFQECPRSPWTFAFDWHV